MFEKGIKLIQDGKLEEAAQFFGEEIEKNPKNELAYVHFGQVVEMSGDLEKAIIFYERALELNNTLATAYYALGNVKFELELYDEAEKAFQSALTNGLQESDVYFMIGLTHTYRDNDLLALPYFQRVVELNDTDVEGLFQYGLILAKLENIEQSMEVMEKVIKLDDSHADAYYNLGVCHAYLEHEEEAISMFRRAVEIQADHFLAGNALRLLENK